MLKQMFYQINLASLLGCIALLAQSAGTGSLPKEKVRMTKRAEGTFEVKMLPPSEAAGGSGFVRLSLDKTFAGELQGTSRVEMLASGDGTSPSGGYVALERFKGTLEGRAGGFVMQHSGTMSPGVMEIRVLVTPGTGTGELEGISGTLEIRREGKQHFYSLQYELPTKE